MEKVDQIMKRKSQSKNKSIIFFLFVILITWTLFGTNKYMESMIQKEQRKVDDYKQSIKDLESQEEIQVYSLVSTNQKVLDLMDKRSQITQYIIALDKVARDYGLIVKGFNYSNGELRTKVGIKSDDEYGVSYTKLVNFIDQYRKEEEAMFDLGFVSSVLGNETLQFDMNLTVK